MVTERLRSGWSPASIAGRLPQLVPDDQACRDPRFLDERPAEVERRARKNGTTAVATLVERTSRFLILVPLTGRDSLSVTDAVIAVTDGLPRPFADR